MAEDLLDAIRDQLANFAVGLVQRVKGAGSKVLVHWLKRKVQAVG